MHQKPIFILPLLIILALGTLLFFFKQNKTSLNVSHDYTREALENNKKENNEYLSPISIKYLRTLKFESNAPNIEQELSSGSNYKRYIASYVSDGYKIYGLLTIPNSDSPDGGFPAIIFNHGYIPPDQYKTTEKYVAYVDYLARNGFVVFKIDLRGNGDSEGNPSGTYFSSGYTIDALNAVKSLERYNQVNANRIGLWGHSMSGNLVLRAMEVLPDIKAGVIWAGAVYSYEDFAKYRISDNSYSRRARTNLEPDPREATSSFRAMLNDEKGVNFDDPLWESISLTKNLNYLNSPIQIHHAIDDPVVNVGYSRDLVMELKEYNKVYEYFEYPNGGHNIDSPSFEKAMQKTVEFFKANL